MLVLGLPEPTVHCTVCPESKELRFLVHLVPNFWSSIEARQPKQISEVGNLKALGFNIMTDVILQTPTNYSAIHFQA